MKRNREHHYRFYGCCDNLWRIGSREDTVKKRCKESCPLASKEPYDKIEDTTGRKHPENGEDVNGQHIIMTENFMYYTVQKIDSKRLCFNAVNVRDPSAKPHLCKERVYRLIHIHYWNPEKRQTQGKIGCKDE